MGEPDPAKERVAVSPLLERLGVPRQGHQPARVRAPLVSERVNRQHGRWQLVEMAEGGARVPVVEMQDVGLSDLRQRGQRRRERMKRRSLSGQPVPSGWRYGWLLTTPNALINVISPTPAAIPVR